MAWSSIESVASPLSGNSFIDSLISQDHFTYNYELPQKGYIDYTFNVSSNLADPGLALQTMTPTQEQDVRGAMSYISGVTGITFKEQTTQTSDDIVFADQSSAPTNAGVDYSNYNATENNGSITGLTLYDTITLNSNNPDNTNPAPGGDGYLTILHEMGHALGLKHPFEQPVVLPNNIDNTNYTVMSYNTVTPYATSYGPIDIAALRYLYGGDGLLGQYGLTVNSAGVPVSNPAPNTYDTLVGLPATTQLTPNPEIIDSDSTSSYQTAGLGSSVTLGLTTLDAFVNSQSTSTLQHGGASSVLAQA
jgi:hypothetical protein